MITEFMEIENQIKALKEKQSAIHSESQREHKRLIEKRSALHERIRTSEDEDFLLEILTARSIVDTPKYSFNEFQIIADKENISEKVFNELIKHDYLLRQLIFNRGLSFEKRCLALKLYTERFEN